MKIGAPHVVDHGPENVYSPDGAVYMVAMGCPSATSSSDPAYNCSWISGDAIFVLRVKNVHPAIPSTMNNVDNWEFAASSSTSGEKWTHHLKDAEPVFVWPGRVGTVTATYWKERTSYLFCVTTPTVMPLTVSTFDSYVLMADDLFGGSDGFKVRHLIFFMFFFYCCLSLY